MLKAKTCGRCRQVRPVESFSANRSRPDGLCHYCRECKAAAAAERYTRNPETVREAARRWYREHPEQGRSRSRTYRETNRSSVQAGSRESKRRRRQTDIESVRAVYRAWRASNREVCREYDRRRRAALKHGAAIHPFTSDQLAAKVAYWGDRCWMCGGPFQAIDHVKPLAKGGSHMLANLRPACTACNTRKRDQWPLTAA